MTRGTRATFAALVGLAGLFVALSVANLHGAGAGPSVSAPTEFDEAPPGARPAVVVVPSITRPPRTPAPPTPPLEICNGRRRRSFEPLGSFFFWGKWQTAAEPCPTSGFNNQLSLVFALVACAAKNQAAFKLTEFRWNDISCTPTGGKIGRSSFRVGSDDYEYAWFRWSEIFAVPDPMRATHRGDAAADATTTTTAKPRLPLCLSDNFTWSEHPVVKRRCATNIGHLYGSPEYWRYRALLPLRPRYERLARCFIRFAAAHRAAGAGDWAALSENATAAAAARAAWRNCGAPSDGSADAELPLTVGLHVRRGDYENFCRGIVKNSGQKKFRVPPFVQLRSNATAGFVSEALEDGKHVMRVCLPDNDAVKRGLDRAVRGPNDGAAKATVVVVATNDKQLLKAALAGSAKDGGALAVDFRGFLLAAHGGDEAAAKWPPALHAAEEGDEAFARWVAFKPTDHAMLDVVLLSLCRRVVLNRYSTFSQTALDLHYLRHGGFVDKHVLWW